MVVTASKPFDSNTTQFSIFPFTPGLKLKLKKHLHSHKVQCDFSYSWAPFTESPSPDVIDRWIELSEKDVGFKHIRLENVSDNLRTGIEAAEGSSAVALIVINNKDNYILNPEVVDCASKGSFPVVIITDQDGKKVKEHMKKETVIAMLQTAREGKCHSHDANSFFVPKFLSPTVSSM